MSETIITPLTNGVTGHTTYISEYPNTSSKGNVSKESGLGLLESTNISSFSRTLVFAAINFFILSVIFIATLLLKLRALYRSGDETQENYVINAFVRGLILGFIAAAIFAIVDFVSGGIATIVMFLVYPLSGIAMLVLSLIAPSFMEDINETTEGLQPRISAYRLWSVVFWPLFITGMLVSLAMGALVSYLGSRMSRLILDMLAGLASNQTGALNLKDIMGV